MNSAEKIWEMAMPILAETLTPTAISSWFASTQPISFHNDVLTLFTQNSLTKDMLEMKFSKNIKDAFFELLNCEIELVITTEQAVAETEAALQQQTQSGEVYTFEEFIVGSSNTFAHAAAKAVAQNPVLTYNPLFIYGPSGLGKTHLLKAIASSITKSDKSTRAIYIKGEDFTNEFVSAIQKGEGQEFREKYRMADLLLVDDIQFIAGKERTQEEFFHTFNTLHELGKQIVLTSDRPPKEIYILEDRLKTRFENGLIADIQPPDYETRLAIMRAKTDRYGITIPSEISDYIARTIVSNVRQLEGTVKKMFALHDLMGKPITMELAEEAIKDVFSESPGLNPTPDLIIKEVAKYYSISKDKLSAANRSQEVVLPRQIGMYLVRQLTNYSLPEIGKVFSKDHTTVLHSIKKIETLLLESNDMKGIIENLKKNIRNQ